MKRIINTLVILSALTSLFSCNMEDVVDVPVNEAIVLDLSSGLTKAETDLTKPDTPTESYVHHIDVFIFDDNAGRPAVLKHYEHEISKATHPLSLDSDKPKIAHCYY